MAESNQKLGQYTLLEKIAQGGMAQVFKAKTIDPKGIERLVVIKRILPHISSNSQYVKMLIDEAKIAVNFTHGNIAQVYDLGCIDEDYFIVMEYVDGKTLGQTYKKLNAKKVFFPIEVLLYIFIEVCYGLSYVHRRKGSDGKNLGVVHRDISPQNIMVTYGGNIKIIDFGVAKSDFKEEKTESGVLKGKFAYMSPEQARGEQIDFRSDVFSLGVLLWEMLTGERLFKRKTNQDTVKAVQKGKVPSVRDYRKNLPSSLDQIIAKCLQKNAKKRYEDAADIAMDLEKLLFALNPDFKPIHVAKFIHHLFADDPARQNSSMDLLFADESVSLTPKSDVESISEDPAIFKTDEITIREPFHFDTNATPIGQIEPKKNKTLMWLTIGVVVLFLIGTFYVYLSHRKSQMAFVTLKGLEHDMEAFIDGKQVFSGEKIQLLSGHNFLIRITREKYQDFVKEVQLNPQEHRIVKIELKKLVPKFGDLTVLSKPSGATVYLNGMEWNKKTPVTIRELIAGKKYKIGIFKKNYKFETREVQIIGGRETRIDNILQVDFGVLKITTNPPDATIYINDKKLGQTPFEYTEIEPEKKIKIKILKDFYEIVEVSVMLLPGKSKKLHFDLEPIQTEEETTSDDQDSVQEDSE